MDQHDRVAERDLVTYDRYGVAPTLAFGIDTPTRLTLSYFKEVENNIPDYGVPFIDGAPAHVDRNNFYGLANYDRTRTNSSIGTVRFEHDFADDITVSDSLRYATYGFEYLVTGSFLGNDFLAPPPSSGGDLNMVINRTDVTRKFELGGLKNTLTGGLELSKEESNVTRFQNGLDDIAPTPILAPNPFNTPPTPLVVYSAPQGRGNDVSVYGADNIGLGPMWDVDLALRWDHFYSTFKEPFSGTGFARTDIFVSPRLAVIFKPDESQSYYLSYGTSYNPVIEYLIVAPSDQSLSPEKNSNVEVGAKIRVLDGAATITGALFDTKVTDARISDPDDPTVQQAPFDQLVRGVEIGMNGYLTKIWELSANYTHLNDKITATSDPLSMDKSAPDTPHDAFNIWTTLEPTSAVAIAGGATAVSRRYADTENTAGVPGYVVFNAMTSYQFNDHLKLQVNLNNVANKLYFTSIYYVGVAENHALPSAGRTLIANVSCRF
jgi:catecholate siderophore receptor